MLLLQQEEPRQELGVSSRVAVKTKSGNDDATLRNKWERDALDIQKQCQLPSKAKTSPPPRKIKLHPRPWNYVTCN